MNLSDDNPALKQIIVDSINEAGGSISFTDYMELALYHRPYGYYLARDPTRDYQSSPNVHPLFGALIARQVAELWQLMGSPDRFDLFEAGAGSGRLAADILQFSRTSHPDFFEALRYVVQDRGLTDDAADTALQRAGLPADKVSIAAELPADGSIEGVVLSNELLDALPFHRLLKRDGVLRELRVGLEDGRFVDVEAELPSELRGYLDWLGAEPAEGCQAEAIVGAQEWVTRAAASLRRGYLLTLDYGYETLQLYASWRKRGTLLTFYRHGSDDDPYRRVGLQDITCSVDLTAVRRAGEEAGLRTIGAATQTGFLAALGVGEALAQAPAPDEIEAYYALRRAAIELTDPAGLGRISVMLQGKEMPETTPSGFASP